MTGMNFTVLPTPVKSESDKKDYRYIELGNGLRALLISDTSPQPDEEEFEEVLSGEESGSGSEGEEEEAGDDPEERGKPKKKQAAAALCVGVGSFHDPEEFPGLAHFLEHMVFMGSKKYPDENYFDQFIRSHGGNDNACTQAEYTVYQFQVNPAFFKEALDIWAQFFVAPLLKQDSIDREVKAVDSEFQMALVNDQCRLEQVLASMCKPNHPISKFMWGNEKSLKLGPAEKGKSIHDALCSFYKKFYHARDMTLTVQSTEDLDTLQGWVADIFSHVPNQTEKDLVPTFRPNIPFPIDDKTPFRIYHVKPIKNVQGLQVFWFLPPQKDFYKTKPLDYVTWLLGHEGRGSLLSLLKKKSYALSVITQQDGSGLGENVMFSAFSVEVILTDLGYQNYEEVLDLIFQYVEMMKGVSESEMKRVYSEIQQIEEIDFKFQEESEAVRYVERVCEYAQKYEPEDILTGDNILVNYDAKIIKDAVDQIIPSKALLALYSAENPNKILYSEKEPWFESEYKAHDIKPEWTNRWKEDSKTAVNPELHLPSPNQFLAENFNIIDGDNSPAQKLPTLISNVDYQLWYKPDHKFVLPKGYVNFMLYNPLGIKSAKNIAYLDLFVEILNLNVAEVAYNATVSSLSYSIGPTNLGGLLIKMNGYNDKLILLFETLLQFVSDFTVTEELFHDSLLHLRKHYYNAILSPKRLCRDVRLQLLDNRHVSLTEKYSDSKNLTIAGLRDFARNYFSQLYVEGLAQGNFTKEESQKFGAKIFSVLKCTPLCKDVVARNRVLELPTEPHFVKLQSENMKDDNSMITLYIQAGPNSVLKSVNMELLDSMIEEPCFDILRTKQQLGYSVYSMDHNTFGILGLSVNVNCQNNKFSVEEVTDRIYKFLYTDFAEILEKMSEKDFESHRQSLIELKQNDDCHLGEEFKRNWQEIDCKDYNFDRLDQEIKHLEQLTLNQIKDFFKLMLVDNKKQLTVQVRGNTSSACDLSEPNNHLGEMNNQTVKTASENGNLKTSEIIGNGVLDTAKLNGNAVNSEAGVVTDGKHLQSNGDDKNVTDSYLPDVKMQHLSKLDGYTCNKMICIQDFGTFKTKEIYYPVCQTLDTK